MRTTAVPGVARPRPAAIPGSSRVLREHRWGTSRLWRVGAPVPYPAQRAGTEVMLEFLGEPDGTAAPRLAQLGRTRPSWPTCGRSSPRHSWRWP
ncbi:MAG: kinase 1, partial [Pseudonocardiales bacterium]|nr:kinase 1 [Pseudonocardiales bacterium]